jgi:anthranilate synthase/aminodeoxychorismate synthase-like glutamine amidotransferase
LQEFAKFKEKMKKQQIDILMIDNYDSFTFNLVQYFGILGAKIKVCRNDKIGLTDIEEMKPLKIVISPGPGRPVDAGISNSLIKHFYKKIPILGVCLGHQCIGEVFGADIINSGIVVHGKTSLIYHDGKTIFKGLENPFKAARYHSLIINKSNIPSCFEVSSTTEDEIVMGIRHKNYKLEGIQFHPESFLTPYGSKILQNFLYK